MSADQRNAHWAARRRPVRSGEPVVLAPTGPRFPRFAAAMAAARAAHAPQIASEDAPPADDFAPTIGRASAHVTLDGAVPGYGVAPPLSRKAPRLASDDLPPAYHVAPTLSGNPPRSRAAQWRTARAPRRPFARWFGIGSCVLVFGLVALTMLSEPVSVELERLIRPWLEWRQPWQTAAPPTPRAPSATPAPAAGRDDPPSEQRPVVARDDLADAGSPAAVAPAAVAPAAVAPAAAAPADGIAAPAPDDEPPVRTGVPLPSFKPSPEDQ